jgi:hypothetical protein
MRSNAHVRICGNPGWVTTQGDPANPRVHFFAVKLAAVVRRLSAGARRALGVRSSIRNAAHKDERTSRLFFAHDLAPASNIRSLGLVSVLETAQRPPRVSANAAGAAGVPYSTNGCVKIGLSVSRKAAVQQSTP